MCLFKSGDILVCHFDFALLIIIFIIILAIGVNDILLVLFLSDIALISKHNYADIGATMLFDLLEPSVNIDE